MYHRFTGLLTKLVLNQTKMCARHTRASSWADAITPLNHKHAPTRMASRACGNVCMYI